MPIHTHTFQVVEVIGLSLDLTQWAKPLGAAIPLALGARGLAARPGSAAPSAWSLITSSGGSTGRYSIAKVPRFTRCFITKLASRIYGDPRFAQWL
jgi:hypothetical protein